MGGRAAVFAEKGEGGLGGKESEGDQKGESGGGRGLGGGGGRAKARTGAVTSVTRKKHIFGRRRVVFYTHGITVAAPLDES